MERFAGVRRSSSKAPSFTRSLLTFTARVKRPTRLLGLIGTRFLNTQTRKRQRHANRLMTPREFRQRFVAKDRMKARPSPHVRGPGGRRSKHRIGIGRLLRYDLEDIPMFDDLAIGV